MAKTGAQRQQEHKDRKRQERAAGTVAILGANPDIARLVELLTEARELAGKINKEVVANLLAKPLDRETATLLNAYEGKEMRITMPKVDIYL